jgi:hypothetical protein
VQTLEPQAEAACGYVHKLRIESRELTGFDGADLIGAAPTQWRLLIGKLLLAVCGALSLPLLMMLLRLN